MRTILPFLMAALLLIQAVSGSCWQPARACVGLQTAADLACTHKCCDSGCEDSGEDKPSQDPCKCRLECSGICTFLAPEKPQIDSAQLSVAFDYPAAHSALADRQADYGFGTAVALGAAEFQPPLRLHLLHQVLLT